MPEYLSPTPEEIRQWQTSRGLTQRQAAEKLLVPYRTYQDWEGGKGIPPTMLRLALGAVAYGLPAWYGQA